MSCIDSHVLRSAAAVSRCDYELYGWHDGVAKSVCDVLCGREFDLEIDAHIELLTPEERELWWRLHACRRRIELAMTPSSELVRRYYARREEVREFLFPPEPAPCEVYDEDILF